MNAENLRLGQLITTPQQRDAVHIAVIPVEATENLEPGWRVVVADGKARLALGAEAWTGVVDPYLQVRVSKGDRFWLFLRPGSITSLRHEWTHPEFPADTLTAREESRRWLLEEANSCGLTLDRLLEQADEGEICSQDTTYGQELGDKAEEFWLHVERYTGRRYDAKHRDKAWFSCSC